jgi:2,4-dienoyl-CoA reductase-like NADH-dependent reductase (Old Yellow Enzyme family)
MSDMSCVWRCADAPAIASRAPLTKRIAMISHAQKKLFTPVRIGPITLKHRIVMPPMSRLQAQWPSGVPSDLMLEYYSQRASDGGLIFTEATAVAASARGYRGAPGIYNNEQVTGWKRITDAVHAKGGYMFVQLWHAVAILILIYQPEFGGRVTSSPWSMKSSRCAQLAKQR